MGELTDRELFLRCCEGDEEAWSVLYGYVLSITRWARWGLDDMAEDVAQAVVLHLMERGLAMVRSADAFRSFVRRTTINRVLDHFRAGEVRLRHRGRPSVEDDRPEADPIVSYPDEGPTVESQAVSRHDLARWDPVLERLAALGVAREELVLAFDFTVMSDHSLTHEMISMRDQALGWVDHFISVQIKRCLEHFRQAALTAGLLEPN